MSAQATDGEQNHSSGSIRWHDSWIYHADFALIIPSTQQMLVDDSHSNGQFTIGALYAVTVCVLYRVTTDCTQKVHWDGLHVAHSAISFQKQRHMLLGKAVSQTSPIPNTGPAANVLLAPNNTTAQRRTAIINEIFFILRIIKYKRMCYLFTLVYIFPNKSQVIFIYKKSWPSPAIFYL